MNEWEAKYRALLAAISNPVYIDNAEKLVRVAYEISTTTELSFATAFDAIYKLATMQEASYFREMRRELYPSSTDSTLR